MLLLIPVAIILLLIVVLAQTYNTLYKARQQMQQAGSDIQTVISRKLSSVNQLMDLVRSYQQSEQFTHLKVSKDVSSVALATANQSAQVMLNGLMTVADRFPNLKSSEQYQRLIDSIQEVEVDIQNHRQYYNALVTQYNESAFTFPTVLVSGLMGFEKGLFFEMDTSQLNEPVRLEKFQTEDPHYLGQLMQKDGYVSAPSSPRALEAPSADGSAADAWVLNGFGANGKRIRYEIRSNDDYVRAEGVLIGRDAASCDLVLDDASVSRRHARVSLRRGQLFIEDLNSSNGTVVNGTRLAPGERARLEASSQIVIGQLSLNVT